MPEQDPASPRPTVVVIGGGYGGITAAKALDDVADVVLVEPKDAFVHNVAAWRALVEPEWLERIFLPYDRLLARGRVAHDRAHRVEPGHVTLASGEEIAADYVVLASGSRYPFPAKSDALDTTEAQVKYRAAHAALVAADRVLLLGAGPSGLELAGEIKAAFPDKHVIVTDPADDLLAGRFSAELRAELRRQLDALGVELHLGTSLREQPATPPTVLAPVTVTTKAGAELSADVWYRAYGVVPVTDYLAAELAAARQPDGRLAVTPELRVEGHDTVFALGDIANADAQMAGMASRQAELVAANIRALITGEGEVGTYTSLGPVILVPLGPEGGAGQLPGQDAIAPPEVTSQIKGQTMMVEHYAELMGVADVTARG